MRELNVRTKAKEFSEWMDLNRLCVLCLVLMVCLVALIDPQKVKAIEQLVTLIAGGFLTLLKRGSKGDT